MKIDTDVVLALIQLGSAALERHAEGKKMEAMDREEVLQRSRALEQKLRTNLRDVFDKAAVAAKSAGDEEGAQT